MAGKAPAAKPRLVTLSGGVGGAKLALGLAHLLPPEDVVFVANTADDFEHLGLAICPDLDTVLYTLADWNNKELGWGQVEESWHCLDALERLGGETWFRLGDKDLATHLLRTSMLASGAQLDEVAARLCEAMGVRHQVLPMTNDRVRTVVQTREQGDMPFQRYFVESRCEPAVTGFKFDGIETATPTFMDALGDADAVIIGPSNPFVSVAPILSLPGVAKAIHAAGLPVVVVSNIVAGDALKGPAAKMMTELGLPQTALGVAEHYAASEPKVVRGFVLDTQDAAMRDDIEALGLSVLVTNTVMVTLQDRIDLARQVTDFAHELKQVTP